MPKNQMYTAAEIKAINKKAQILKDRVFYNIRSILGNNDCIFYFLLGGPQSGKCCSVTDFYCSQQVKYGTLFYWIRLTDA